MLFRYDPIERRHRKADNKLARKMRAMDKQIERRSRRAKEASEAIVRAADRYAKGAA